MITQRPAKSWPVVLTDVRSKMNELYLIGLPFGGAIGWFTLNKVMNFVDWLFDREKSPTYKDSVVR